MFENIRYKKLAHSAAFKPCPLGQGKNMRLEYQSSSKPRAKARGVEGLIFLLLVIICFNAFFINKAFHIDDPFTLNIARAVNKNFVNMPVVFSGNPILLGYYYGPVIKMFGEKEIWLHIFYLPFTLLVVVSLYLLSCRFIGKNLIPALLLSVTPAFLVISQGIMLDIPMLAFFLLALYFFILGIDNQRLGFLFLSGVLAGLAILIKYSALMLIPIMLVYGWLFSRKRHYLLYLFIPAIIFLLWPIHNLLFYKQFTFVSALLYRIKMYSFETFLLRVFGCLSFISGTSLVGLLLTPLLLRNKTNRLLFLISLPIGLSPFLVKSIFSEYSILEKFFLTTLFISSFFMICIICKAIFRYIFMNEKDKDNLFLSAWFLLLLVFAVSIQFIAARFILLLLPPMILLIYKELQDIRLTQHLVFKKAVFLVIFISFMISTLLAIGDYQFAGLYRDFILRLKNMGIRNEEFYSCPKAYSTYYAWGYAYYLNLYYPYPRGQDNSAKYKFAVFPQEKVLPIVIEKSCIFYPGQGGADKVISINTSEYRYRGHIFLHNRSQRTGFYSHDWGLLPFKVMFENSTLEEFKVYKLLFKS